MPSELFSPPPFSSPVFDPPMDRGLLSRTLSGYQPINSFQFKWKFLINIFLLFVGVLIPMLEIQPSQEENAT